MDVGGRTRDYVFFDHLEGWGRGTRRWPLHDLRCWREINVADPRRQFACVRRTRAQLSLSAAELSRITLCTELRHVGREPAARRPSRGRARRDSPTLLSLRVAAAPVVAVAAARPAYVQTPLGGVTQGGDVFNGDYSAMVGTWEVEFLEMPPTGGASNFSMQITFAVGNGVVTGNTSISTAAAAARWARTPRRAPTRPSAP